MRSFPTLPALVASLCLSNAARCDPAQDYAQIVRDGRSLRLRGTAGSLAVEGAHSLSLALSEKGEVVVAAGALGSSPKAGRIVAFAHTSLAVGDENAHLRQTAIQWATHSTQPTVMLLGVSAKEVQSDSGSIRFVPWNAAGLGGVDGVLVHAHNPAFAEQAAALEAFVQKGGGMILAATPWALSAPARETARRLLQSAGLAFLNPGPTDGPLSISAQPPAHLNATSAASALAAEFTGGNTMGAADRQRSCSLVEGCIAARLLGPTLQRTLDQLHAARGWIPISRQKPLQRKASPLESLLVIYEDYLLEQLPPERIPVHPSAGEFPGAVGEGPAVTRTVGFRAETGPDKLVNHGDKTRISTGLYARPGTVVEVHIPEAATRAGLVLELGIHTDANWPLDTWKRFPHVARKIPLLHENTRVASAFGGLLSILLPENCHAGDVSVSISGAVESPVYVVGQTSREEWNMRIKNAPGAWGYIQTPKWTGYFRRDVLLAMENPEAVGRYWQKVLDTADEFLGYTRWRKRGEAMLTDHELFAGYGHAGYPVEMAYEGGTEDDQWALARRGPERGDWGFLHELGHTFQDNFDGAYTIATHAEVDVNLVPALIKNRVHDITCWDGKHHSTFDAPSRLADLQKWAELPEAERTWTKACSMKVAYDFYFTLAECFGWELYRKAFSRWMDWLQKPGADPAMDRITSKGAQAKRDRFFLLFCEGSGRNLMPFFQKYGLGRGEHDVSPAVVETVKSLPAWSGNQDITHLAGPGEITVRRNAKSGEVLARFQATDPDPGTIFTYRIVEGNGAGDFSLEQRTGVLRLQEGHTAKPAILTIRAQDNCVPLSTKEITCRILVP